MKTSIPWLASVLLAMSAVSAKPAQADQPAAQPAAQPAPALQPVPQGCSSCGDGCCEGKHHWHPGAGIFSLCEKFDACMDALCAKSKSLCPPCYYERKYGQPIQPQFMYNPYFRSPRDYFMEDTH